MPRLRLRFGKAHGILEKRIDFLRLEALKNAKNILALDARSHVIELVLRHVLKG